MRAPTFPRLTGELVAAEEDDQEAIVLCKKLMEVKENLDRLTPTGFDCICDMSALNFAGVSTSMTVCPRWTGKPCRWLLRRRSSHEDLREMHGHGSC